MRINAVLRRRQPAAHPAAPGPKDSEARFGPYRLNLATRILIRGEESIPLTSGEFSLPKVFLEHDCRPLTREKLLELARGRELEPYDRSIDVQVSRLRRLTERNPAEPRYIQTVWGHGYVFVADPE